ncbi:putative FASCICLIN-like arabinogalactan protein 21 precursor [Hibiscus syriacus]|uniref:FASCICLIN-like arabinogalactan protein 21 n=1 Tax=Hibiscus syriacus TaxID=106335 RepID=A0A6A2XDY4_HIBSY|nr:putative FASCICLIN-like arabinogalactan protein 21 precursor [Hibiscus syriacus]
MAVAKLVFVSFVLVEVLVLIHVAEAEKPEVDVEPREIKVHDQDRPGWAIPREAEEPTASSTIETREAEAPEIRRLGKHHASDSSMAGGGVIIGGLATAVFLAVFAYIRVTRKINGVQVQQH